MLNLGGQTKVFVRNMSADLRKSIDGLSALVSVVMLENPLSSNVFVFLQQG